MGKKTLAKKLIDWEVVYDVSDCPGAAFTTITKKKATIQAPDDREAAKKVAAVYLDALNNGARGRGLWKKKK